MNKICCGLYRHLTALALVGIVTLCANAEVGPADNLLLNGRFDADQMELPLYWYSPNVPQVISAHASGGPDGLPFVRFAAPSGKVSWRESCLRQRGIELVSNGTYRISAWVRTKGFRAASSGIGIANTGWTSSCVLSDLPEDCEWRELKRDVVMCGSSDGTYSAVIYANDFSGELDIADFRLFALDAAACAGSNHSQSGATTPRLVPWEPLLHRISRTDRKVRFRFFGKVPSGRVEDYDVVLNAEDGQACVSQRLKSDLNTFVLPLGAEGGKLYMSIIGRKDGKAVFAGEYSYSLVDAVTCNADGHRRLNNLVTEVLSAPIAVAYGEQRFEFTTLRKGWTFTALRAEVKPGVEVLIDGKSVIHDDTPRLETFRFIPAGRHVVCVRNGGTGGHIVVRTIPELFNYCPGVDNSIAENPHYDWDFQMKHMFPSVTTLNGGMIPPGKIDWLKANGYRWLANFQAEDLSDDRELARRLASFGGIRKPQYDGVTCDELFFGRFDQIQRYTTGLRAFDGVDDHFIYTWIVGKPGLSGVDHDFMSACCNASRGDGRLLCEAYCRTKATEKEARTYLARYVGDTFASFKAWYPLAAQATGVIFGNFNQIPILSLSHHPEVDYKYFLDMQLHYVATDPIFDGLGCVGYWGSSYANEEQYRWSFMLLRHYCIEGRTDMLSGRYGLTYIPGLLRNGDFRGTLEPWVATGEVRTESHLGFGSRAQNRWGDNGDLGDTFAAIGHAASLSQHVRGLVPGRLYCLQVSVFSVKDAKADKVAPRRFPLACNLVGNVEVLPSLSWTHVDRRIKGRYARNNGVARTNLHHVIFKAKGQDVEVVLRNDSYEELGVNCISLNPYVVSPESKDDDVCRDIVIYGSSPAAISASIQAIRMGKSAVIVSPETRIGGLTTGGLGQTDIGNKSAFGGIALEFYKAVAAYYSNPTHWTRQTPESYFPDGQCAGSKGKESMWTFEPSAALAILEGWEKRNGLEIRRGEWLDREHGVEKQAGRIVAIRTLSGKTYRGKVFVDATYEGDLMAAADVSYAVGREANAVYGETLNGNQPAQAVFHQLNAGVDPYVVKGDVKSGFLFGVEPYDPTMKEGDGDRRVQAYCFRMCLTDDPANRIPFAKPESYDERDYEMLFRHLAIAPLDGSGMPWINSRMPNRKTDTNNRTGFATDFIGQNWKWPEASYAEREKIRDAHLNYQRGLMWTLANHPRVPEKIRNEVAKWGTCKDEFTDGLGNGWQKQLYVREARRMVGEYVMTEHNCWGTKVAPRPVAMGAYQMDSHHVRRYVGADGFVHNEGDVEVGVDAKTRKRFKPYPIDYGAVLPKRGECANLIVPVCLSASHIAFGSIRMEPVFFALGQVAGTAAAIAVSHGVGVHDVPYDELAKRLVADGQIIK